MTRQAMIQLFEEAATLITERDIQGLDESTSLSTLGIDSLGMLELVGELERRVGVQVPDDQLVNVTSMRDLIDLVERQRHGGGAS